MYFVAVWNYRYSPYRLRFLKTILLSDVLHGYDMRSHTLRKEQRVTVLRGMFGDKGEGRLVEDGGKCVMWSFRGCIPQLLTGDRRLCSANGG
jgi:hypothetical protein